MLVGRLISVGVAVLAGMINAGATAQTTEPLPNYPPLLPQVRARVPQIDPRKGFLVEQLKPGIYMITDGGYESAFATTGQGVVLFDAPPSFAKHILQAVAETTKEPVVELVYSHAHVDHIGGADLILSAIPNLKIVAEEGTAKFLREIEDPHRPLPTETFQNEKTLTLGTLQAEMKVGHWHSPDGDLFIQFPAQKVVIAIDALSSGAVPFMGLDLTQNMHAYLQIFDQLMATDFDVMVPGHHSLPATKDDVRITRDYVHDVYDTVQRILSQDHASLVQRAVVKYGPADTFAVGSVLIDAEQKECARELKGRWESKLEDVDVWAESHCHTALVYAQWDVGRR